MGQTRITTSRRTSCVSQKKATAHLWAESVWGVAGDVGARRWVSDVGDITVSTFVLHTPNYRRASCTNTLYGKRIYLIRGAPMKRNCMPAEPSIPCCDWALIVATHLESVPGNGGVLSLVEIIW